MPFRLVCLIAILLLQLLPAFGQDFVVLESSAELYEPGQAFRTDDRIELPAGADIAFIAASGEVFRLEGPHSGAIAAPPDLGPGPPRALASLAAILGRAARKTASLGAAREAEQADRLAAPDGNADVWTVDAQSAGAQCVKPGAVELLRLDATEALSVTIWPLSGATRTAEWRAGERLLVLDRDSTITSGTQLSISGGKAPMAIILWQLPGDIDASSSGEVLLWLSARGCEAQALQLAPEIAREAAVGK